MPSLSIETPTNFSTWTALTQWGGAAAIFVVSAGLTLFAWQWTLKETVKEHQRQVEEQSNLLATSIQVRTQQAEQLLRAAAVFVEHNPNLTAADWATYNRAIDLERLIPSARYFELLDADNPSQSNGLLKIGDFKIRYSAQQNIVDTPRVGRIVSANPVWRDALERAVITYHAAISSRLDLPTLAGEPSAGSVLVMARYAKDAPNKNLPTGAIALTFDVGSIFSGLIDSAGKNFRVEVFDEDFSRNLPPSIYSTHREEDAQHVRDSLYAPIKTVEAYRSVEIGDRPWTLRVTPSGPLAANTHWFPEHYVLLIGSLMSLVVTGLSYSILRSNRRVQRAMSRLIYSDPLTNTLNRRGLSNAYRIEVTRTTRFNAPLSLAILDLDDFKQLNDQYGHPNGDRALQHVVDILRQVIRPTDHIARYGGEEFVVLFNSPADVAAKVIDRVRDKLADSPLSISGQRELFICFSAGVTQQRQHEALESLLQRADEALYAAKVAGKNRVVIT